MQFQPTHVALLACTLSPVSAFFQHLYSYLDSVMRLRAPCFHTYIVHTHIHNHRTYCISTRTFTSRLGSIRNQTVLLPPQLLFSAHLGTFNCLLFVAPSSAHTSSSTASSSFWCKVSFFNIHFKIFETLRCDPTTAVIHGIRKQLCFSLSLSLTSASMHGAEA